MNDARDRTLHEGDEVAPFKGSAAALFGVLWEALLDVLGPATTATLLRRGAKYAAVRRPALVEIHIRREGFDYRYSLPATWQREDDPDSFEALRELVGELCQLLVPLTGQVVVRRLANLPDLQRCGLFAPGSCR